MTGSEPVEYFEEMVHAATGAAMAEVISDGQTAAVKKGPERRDVDVAD